MLVVYVLWGSATTLAYEGDPEAARPINTRAATAYRAGNYADAAQLFEEAYQAYQHPEFLYNRAQCQRQLSQYEPALVTYRRYVEAGGQEPGAHVLIGECLLQLNRQREARQAFERYLELQPEGPLAAQARQAIESGQPPSGQDRRDPDQVREAQEFFDRAVAEYTASHDVEPFARSMRQGFEQYNMPEFLLSAGTAYQMESRYREAASMFDRYLGTPGADPEVWADLGNAALMYADNERALTAYRRYVSLCPQGRQLADVRHYIERLERSEPAAEQAQEAAQAVRRGQELYDAGQVQQALREFERAHQLVPQDRAVLHNICMCYTSMSDWQNAATHWEEYLQEAWLGHDAVCRLFAARAYIELGNAARAREHIQEYMEAAEEHDLPNEDVNRRYAEGLLRDVERISGGSQ